MPKGLNKQQVAELDRIRAKLQSARTQLESSIFYFEAKDQSKGFEWGYAALDWTKDALAGLKELFPEED